MKSVSFSGSALPCKSPTLCYRETKGMEVVSDLRDKSCLERSPGVPNSAGRGKCL